MYGLGGGFGGMPYESPAGAIAAGISAGQSYMLRAQEDQERRERWAYERNRDDRLDAMHQAQIDFNQRHTLDEEQREHARDALEALKLERESIGADGQALFEQFGSWDKVPQDMLVAQHAKTADFNERWDAALQALHGDNYEQNQNKAQATLRGMSDGSIDCTDPKNGQAVCHALAVGTQRDPADFLTTGQEPSAVQQHLANMQQGVQNNDSIMFAKGMNGVMGNQLEAGNLGRLDPTGGVITQVSLSDDRSMIPNRTGSGFYPGINTTAQHTNGAISTQPLAAPTVPGNRDQLHEVQPKQVMDYCGRLGSIANLCSHPAVQNVIRQALQNPDQETLDAVHSITALGNKLGKQGAAHFQEITHDENGKRIREMWSFPQSGGPGKMLNRTEGDIPALEKPQKPTVEEQKFAAMDKLVGQPKSDGSGTWTKEEVAEMKAGQMPRPQGVTEAAVKQMSDAQAEVDQLSGEDPSFTDSMGNTFERYKHDPETGAILRDKEGKVVQDPVASRRIAAELAKARSKLATLRQAYTAQGRPAPRGGIVGPPAPDSDQHEVPSNVPGPKPGAKSLDQIIPGKGKVVAGAGAPAPAGGGINMQGFPPGG